MKPLDLRANPPRGCYAELDGLMLMPRTIDKLRALLPGGNPGAYFINGPIKGISGYLLERLGVGENELLEAVRIAGDEDEVARWLRGRTDASQYPAINQTLRRIKPKHAENEAVFRELYARTLAEHPDLELIVDIVDADDRAAFGKPSSGSGKEPAPA
ncbi:MAG TPA: DUF5069 domain-containing protein [Candidatus Acidoferrales bacterium]|nr:DUF5069 domain-containing protein [Candidatus Acidoferrales bacterium]